MTDRLDTKRERKLQDQLNRLVKLIPGKARIWELERIALDLEVEVDEWPPAFRPALQADVLRLRRLAWDLSTMRDAIRGHPRRATEPLGPRP